ncbi:ABC transporter substrate-binding protein [Thermasporomyces composti]|jgi:arabinosaccharide transport system substrate-binding protein|uniref:L-arabinose-binding protein n=1 Tax=Thermasporomyces composti TaxID=696763 RepID=A0A3D9VI66_THECX|nr:substrate-binding domain-containing protein [Thermasporomyces composti]REF37001.1 L-arabinose-binding protein [Thermasporomyces composti]
MAQISRRSVLKKAAAVGASLAGSSLLSGCGRAPNFNRGAKKKLSFWAFTDTRIAWQQRAFELYKRLKNPDFEIEWLILPYRQMHDQLLVTAQARSGGPDIADVEISQFARYIKGDVLFVDLKPKLVEMGEWDNLYHPSATDPWTWQGKVYGIGNELNACLLSYRWDIWEKAGVNTEIQTWDEFVEEAKRFHRDTGNYLIDQQYLDWGQWWLMTLQQGGGFFDEKGQPVLDSEKSLRTLTWMQQALKDGWSTHRPQGHSYNIALEEGRIASLLGPSWQFSGFIQQNIPKTKGKWHLMPFPRWSEGGSRTATQGGTGVAVLNTSEFIEEALDFVLFEHTNVEALLGDFELRQVWPTYRPAFDAPVLTQPMEFFDGQRVGSLINEVSPEINTTYVSPFWPETTSVFVRHGLTPPLQDLDMSPKDALARAQQKALDAIEFATA